MRIKWMFIPGFLIFAILITACAPAAQQQPVAPVVVIVPAGNNGGPVAGVTVIAPDTSGQIPAGSGDAPVINTEPTTSVTVAQPTYPPLPTTAPTAAPTVAQVSQNAVYATINSPADRISTEDGLTVYGVSQNVFHNFSVMTVGLVNSCTVQGLPGEAASFEINPPIARIYAPKDLTEATVVTITCTFTDGQTASTSFKVKVIAQ